MKDTTIIAENGRKSIKCDISHLKKTKQDIKSEDEWEESPVGQGNVGIEKVRKKQDAHSTKWQHNIISLF